MTYKYRFLEHTRFFEEVLNPSYVYGISTGISFILLMLMSYRGWEYTLKEYQVHVHTFLWLTLIATYYYKQLEKSGLTNLRRFLNAFMYMLFVFEIHDGLWIMSTLFYGIRFSELPVIYPGWGYYYFAFFRWATMTGTATYVLLHKLRFTKKSLALMVLQFSVWGYTCFTGIFWPFIVYNFVDFLPYIDLVKKEP